MLAEAGLGGHGHCMEHWWLAVATVLACGAFGDYQGTWLAKVQWDDEYGWIRDCYGSCEGCDAFESELGYNPSDEDQKAFGLRYKDAIVPAEELLKRFRKTAEWDMEMEDLITFIESN